MKSRRSFVPRARFRSVAALFLAFMSRLAPGALSDDADAAGLFIVGVLDTGALFIAWLVTGVFDVGALLAIAFAPADTALHSVASQGETACIVCATGFELIKFCTLLAAFCSLDRKLLLGVVAPAPDVGLTVFVVLVDLLGTVDPAPDVGVVVFTVAVVGAFAAAFLALAAAINHATRSFIAI